MHVSRRPMNALLPLTAALALALGGWGCGDSDDGSRSDAATPQAGTTADRQASGDDAARGDRDSGGDKTTAGPDGRAGSAPGSADDEPAGSPAGGSGDEQEIAAVVVDMYEAFSEGDAARVCEAMATRARQQVIDSARLMPEKGPATCDRVIGSALATAARAGTLDRVRRPEVRDVDVRGDVAIVTVAFSGEAGDVRLVREDGKWRFGAAAVAPPPS